MKEKLYRFMYGRYGNDALNRFLMVLALILFVTSIFSFQYLYIIGLLPLILVYMRMFSKNSYKRGEENRVYLTYENKVKFFFKKLKKDISQRKTHHIYKCPTCRQKIRIPRGKGKIEVICPKCKTAFIKKS